MLETWTTPKRMFAFHSKLAVVQFLFEFKHRLMSLYITIHYFLQKHNLKRKRLLKFLSNYLILDQEHRLFEKITPDSCTGVPK